jgi:thiol:disulfide interchange protein DsbD
MTRARLALLFLAVVVTSAFGAPPAEESGDPFAGSGSSPPRPPFESRVVQSPDSVTAGAVASFRLRLGIPDGTWVYHERTKVEVLPAPGFEFVGVDAPQPEIKFDPFEEREVPVYKHDTEFTVRIRPGWSGPVRAVLSYQGCNQTLCFFPQSDTLVVQVQVIGSAARDVAATSGDAMTRLQAAADRGFFWLLLLAFGAGFATSLTPCVYPMIPITIGIIGARSAGRRSKGLQLSLLYVLGIALTYSTLGTTAALTGSLFGGILQNVWVVVGVCLVFVVMALSLFGAFEIQVPANFATRMRGVHGSGAPGALLLGLVAGIVASPCIGPVLVAMLAFVAASGSVLLGFTLFFVFALGLGVLFVVLGTFTGLLAGIPKSGNWMLAVRYVFGLVFMGVALYYLHPFMPEGRGVLWVGVALLLGGVLLRGWRLVHETDPAPKRWLGALGRVALVAGLYATILPLVRGESAAVTGPGWLGSEAHAAQKAQSEGKPLMVDFTADWCVACKELEHLTFSDPRVIELAKRFVTVRVDATKQTPEIQELMRKYGIVGLPWVAFVSPDGRILATLTVTGYIDADTMLARMQRALDGEASGS